MIKRSKSELTSFIDWTPLTCWTWWSPPTGTVRCITLYLTLQVSGARVWMSVSRSLCQLTIPWCSARPGPCSPTWGAPPGRPGTPWPSSGWTTCSPSYRERRCRLESKYDGSVCTLYRKRIWKEKIDIKRLLSSSLSLSLYLNISGIFLFIIFHFLVALLVSRVTQNIYSSASAHHTIHCHQLNIVKWITGIKISRGSSASAPPKRFVAMHCIVT